MMINSTCFLKLDIRLNVSTILQFNVIILSFVPALKEDVKRKYGGSLMMLNWGKRLGRKLQLKR